MGEFADMLLDSSDPYDEFERGSSPSTRGGNGGRIYSAGTLEEKKPNYARIDGKEFKVTDRATYFMKYIKVGKRVTYHYSSNIDAIYFIEETLNQR